MGFTRKPITYAQAFKRAEYFPERWNATCQATIPPSWRVLDANGWIIGEGDTREGAARDASN